MSRNIMNNEGSYLGLTKDSLDKYLKELAKTYKKQSGRGNKAEIIIVGGGAILLNYDFRDSTTDIDAVIDAVSTMKGAINAVADKYNLPSDWLNSDFMKTSSYSPVLRQKSKYYKTYYGVLDVRVVTSEYLLAMKLRSSRSFKHDLSDICGIIRYHRLNDNRIDLSSIENAYHDLYGDNAAIPEQSLKYLNVVLRAENIDELYNRTVDAETNNKTLLIRFEKKYPNVVSAENANQIIDSMNAKNNMDRISLVDRLNEIENELVGKKTQKNKQEKDGLDR